MGTIIIQGTVYRRSCPCLENWIAVSKKRVGAGNLSTNGDELSLVFNFSQSHSQCIMFASIRGQHLSLSSKVRNIHFCDLPGFLSMVLEVLLCCSEGTSVRQMAAAEQ